MRLKMGEKVRVGVVGTSGYADWMHLPNLKSHPRAEIVALCGRNRDRADEMAGKYAIPHVFTDYRAMLEKGGLEAVVIAAPDDLHYPITLEALNAGLHILCEKPMALTAEQGREMLARAEAARVKHMIFFTLRGSPWHRYLRELIEEGYIGRCYHCHIEHMMGFGRNGLRGWVFDSRRSLGVLGALGSHAIDTARWLVGDMTRVNAHLTTFRSAPDLEGSPEPANASALLTVEFMDGAQGTLHASAMAHVGERTVVQKVMLYGEAGTLEAEFSFLGGKIHGARQDEPGLQPLPVPDRFWGEADKNDFTDVFRKQPVGDRLFIDAILEDRPVTPDFYDGLKVQEVIDAAIESDRTGQWISLPAS
jgi:predicted dehydrogenase